MELFAGDLLVTDVLVRSAPLGPDMTPNEAAVSGRAAIGRLGYSYVLNRYLVNPPNLSGCPNFFRHRRHLVLDRSAASRGRRPDCEGFREQGGGQ